MGFGVGRGYTQQIPWHTEPFTSSVFQAFFLSKGFYFMILNKSIILLLFLLISLAKIWLIQRSNGMIHINSLIVNIKYEKIWEFTFAF